MILTAYFDNTINLLYTKDAISKYRTTLYNFRNLLAVSEGYTYFNEYYISKMADLEYKADDPTRPIQTSLVVYKESFLKTLFGRLRYLLKLTPKPSYVEKRN